MDKQTRSYKTLLQEVERLRNQVSTLKSTIAELSHGNEEALTSRAFQQTILDGVADPIMVIDQDYRVRTMNQAAREFSTEEALHSHPTFCYQISHQRDTPCDGLEHPCPLERVRTTRQKVKVLHEHCMANGEKRTLEIIAAPYWDPAGTFQGIVESMRDVTDRIRAEKDLKEHADRIRALAAQFNEVSEAERQRLARELHDLVGQNLSALAINLNIIQTQLTGETKDLVGARIEDSLILVEETTDRIRDVMTHLRPPILDDFGLMAALLWYGEKFTHRTGIQVIVEEAEIEPQLDARVENALFRIAQEAITNVAKHAQATSVTLKIDSSEGVSRFFIIDDGIGFTPVPIHEFEEGRGWGLLTMKERAEAVGGACRIESAPNQGTQIIVEIPQ